MRVVTGFHRLAGGDPSGCNSREPTWSICAGGDLRKFDHIGYEYVNTARRLMGLLHKVVPAQGLAPALFRVNGQT